MTDKNAKQILVVDDNADHIETLSSMLQAHGYATASANNGYDACDSVRDKLPSVIIMDLGMPWMDGFGAVRAIRKIPGGQSLPIIALSGRNDADTSRKATDAGFTRHFGKPLNFDHLNSYLSSLS